MELSEKTVGEVAEAILKGRKIEAIKLVREEAGLGLKDAKEYVEQIEAEVRKENPEAFKDRPKGCAWVLVIGTFLGAGLFYGISELIA